MNKGAQFWLVALALVAFIWLVPEGQPELTPEERAALLAQQNPADTTAPNSAAGLTAQEVSAPAAAVQPAAYKTSTLELQAGEQYIPLTVAVADTQQLHLQGLMNVPTWPPQIHGMLFIYDTVELRSMWMKNTLLPLDMLFVDGAGKIVHIAENAKPHDETPISSQQPVKAVIELPAGSVQKWQIKPGYTVRHSSFTAAPQS